MYKKVFSKSRYQTRSQNSFEIDQKTRSLTIGTRPNSHPRKALIGKIIEQGKASNILDFDVYCDVSFPHVVGIFGSRGSGKSFDLGIFLEGIFLEHDEPTEKPVTDAAIVFDVQDQFWTLGYKPSPEVPADEAHLQDMQTWGLSPKSVASLNVLVPEASDTSVPNASKFSLSADQLSLADWLAILELERFSAMGQALLTLINTYGFLTPQELSSRCSQAGALTNFQQQTVDGLRWRLSSLSETKIISATGVSVDDLLKPGQLSVILMRNLHDAVRALVVGVLSRLVADRMGRIQQARKVAMRTKHQGGDDLNKLTNRLWMVLDEAHVLVPAEGQTAATAPMIDYVKRGRDAGLSLIFATQQPSAVATKLISQVDITLTHMLGFEADLSAAVARMPTRSSIDCEVDNEHTASMSDVIRSLALGEAVIADVASGRAFIAKIRPRVSAHGGATPS